MVRKVIGSNTTNASGISTITYKPTELGELKIYAQSGDLISEAYPIYSVIFKDMGTSTDYTDWKTSSTVDIARNTEYTTVSSKDSTVFSNRAVNLPNGANCIEFDVNTNVNTAFVSLRMDTTSVTNLSNEYLGITTELDQWHHIRIEWNETQYRAIVDDDIKDYRNLSDTPNRFQFSINANTGLEIKYKNFIMY